MRPTDDDVKIFHPKKNDGAAADFAALASLTDRFRRNGNVKKADELGKELAELAPETLCPEKAAGLPNNVLFQLRVLMIFSAQLAMHKYLPHPMLASQATNSLYAQLEQNAEGLFANIYEGSSFSFYYLPVRKNKNVEQEIGKNFAMLCDKDDYEPYISLGKEVFSLVDSEVYDRIEAKEFEE